jgi:large subunit ribosomal protein L10
MNLKQKEQVVASLQKNFQTSAASFVVGFRGLTVAQLNDLRRKIKKSGGSVEVAKKTLIKRSLSDRKNAQEYAAFFKDQVALIFAENDFSAVAKVVCDFAHANEKCVVLAGAVDDRILTPDTVKVLATLPSREILLAQTVGTLKAPIARLPFVLKMLIMRLAWALKQVSEKKAAQS